MLAKHRAVRWFWTAYPLLVTFVIVMTAKVLPEGDATVQQAQVLGVHMPDPLLKWNEQRQCHDFGPIDWAEFWRVVGGHGPCNTERLEARVKAWEAGAWVREAALAYAGKQQQRTMKEAA